MAVDEKLQRQVMGRFATGVTVLTTRNGDERCGMTANAVMSLSLDPPLIVVSVEKTAHMHGALLESRCFAVNVLKQEQESLSRRFARKGPKDFSDLSCTVEETGSPILDDALAYADCKVVEVLPGGDHDLFVGELLAADSRGGQPLIFYGGTYARLHRNGAGND